MSENESRTPARAADLVPRPKPLWMKVLLIVLLGIVLALLGRELMKLFSRKL